MRVIWVQTERVWDADGGEQMFLPGAKTVCFFQLPLAPWAKEGLKPQTGGSFDVRDKSRTYLRNNGKNLAQAQR
jgi:hypothetical protein